MDMSANLVTIVRLDDLRRLGVGYDEHSYIRDPTEILSMRHSSSRV